MRSMGEALRELERMGSDLFRAPLCQCHLPCARTPGIPASLLHPINEAADLLLWRTSRSGEARRSKVKDNRR